MVRSIQDPPCRDHNFDELPYNQSCFTLNPFAVKVFSRQGCIPYFAWFCLRINAPPAPKLGVFQDRHSAERIAIQKPVVLYAICGEGGGVRKLRGSVSSAEG